MPNQISKLKVGDMVQNLKSDYSEGKNFDRKPLPAMSVGRVKSVHNFKDGGEPVIYVKFFGHHLVNFYESELKKVRVVGKAVPVLESHGKERQISKSRRSRSMAAAEAGAARRR